MSEDVKDEKVEARKTPSEEQKKTAIENITENIKPKNEQIDLLKDAEHPPKKTDKSISGKILDKVSESVRSIGHKTAVTTKKGDIPERKNSPSTIRNKDEGALGSSESESTDKAEVTEKKATNHNFVESVCSRCGLEKSKATTECFGSPLPRATLLKFNEGTVDFKNGTWRMIEKKDEEKAPEVEEEKRED